jgi:hypothetical protein
MAETVDCFLAIKSATGICLERRVDLGNAILAALSIIGLVSLFLTYRQIRHTKEANRLQANATRAKFVYDLNREFLSNDDERDFFYKLDYLDFKFDPNTFAQSPDERQLDRLLYKLSFVGKLLRDGLVNLDDINNIRHIASRTLKNPEVIEYLRYLKEEQIPDHNSFSDAVYLFERMFGIADNQFLAIKRYLAPSNGNSTRPSALPPSQERETADTKA